MPFTPHTPEDIREMSALVGVESVDQLFDEIPDGLKCPDLELPEGQGEVEISRLMGERAAANRPLVCFAGAGAYEHHIPAAVWEIAQRGEFYSAYTPYQPEASQGTLQVLYEYQSMMAELTGMEVSNASLYDGASALAEAILMAVRVNPRGKRIIVPRSVHPVYRRVVRTLVEPQQIELLELPFDPSLGSLDPAALESLESSDCSALVIPQPNYFGVLESVDALTDWAGAHGILAIGLVNPVALGLLKPPGKWGTAGADIACGDGQPLGAPLSGGGPYFGFLCSRQKYVHQLPGRIAGATLDRDGKTGFTLTLQAREQHIRRGRATSNICTNQGLLATAACIHLALLGAEGLRRVAVACHKRLLELAEQLSGIDGVEQFFKGAAFHETPLRLPRPVPEVLARLAQAGILGGADLSEDYPELGPALLVCATELRSSRDIEAYAQTLKRILES
jgi:glycine dehydrogenase subunit 1